MGLSLSARADKVEMLYRSARRKHMPSHVVWLKLNDLRTRDLERFNRAKKATPAKQLPLFARAA